MNENDGKSARSSSDDARVEQAIEESFPASDAPSWTTGIERRGVAVDPAIKQHLLLPDRPVASYAQYLRWVGGSALRRARELGPDAVLDELARSGLRGRGGAGFPTAVKWRSVRNHECPTRYVVCNAAEGEPGTFKDRFLTPQESVRRDGRYAHRRGPRRREGDLHRDQGVVRARRSHVSGPRSTSSRRAGSSARARSTSSLAPRSTCSAKRRRFSRSSRGTTRSRARLTTRRTRRASSRRRRPRIRRSSTTSRPSRTCRASCAPARRFVPPDWHERHARHVARDGERRRGVPRRLRASGGPHGTAHFREIAGGRRAGAPVQGSGERRVERRADGRSLRYPRRFRVAPARRLGPRFGGLRRLRRQREHAARRAGAGAVSLRRVMQSVLRVQAWAADRVARARRAL